MSWISSSGPGLPASGTLSETAKIGIDAEAVVDPSLRVHNVRVARRVADASVMPSIPAGATNAPTIMIGGRAAMMIKGSA